MRSRSSWVRAPACGAALALLLAGVLAGAGDARAAECSNPCGVANGDVCASMRRVVDLGRPIAARIGRQRGTCGGVEPFADGELLLTWSRAPAGPFTPVPYARRGDDVELTPEAPGVYYLEAAARDGGGAPDRLILVVLAPDTARVRLRLRPGKGRSARHAAVRLRWVPEPGAAGVERFPRRRWPVWRDNDRAGLADRPQRLLPGRYEIEWRHRVGGGVQSGVTTVEVTGPGWLDVPLTPPPATRRRSAPARGR